LKKKIEIPLSHPAIFCFFLSCRKIEMWGGFLEVGENKNAYGIRNRGQGDSIRAFNILILIMIYDFKIKFSSSK
jgi:hypothetical protein